MIWFFGCEVIRHGYLIEGGRVQKGLTELCARPVVRGRHGQTEGRRDVLGKDALKKMGMASPTWGEGLATAIYYGTRFLNMIQIEGPALSTSVAQQVSIAQIIRKPGNNLRYKHTQFPRGPEAPVDMPALPSGRERITRNQSAMNAFILRDTRHP
jgi:hypothetical protein